MRDHTLLDLQRTAGNRAVTGLLTSTPVVQRYTVEQNYTLGGGHQQTMFQSQGLRHGTGTYARVTKRQFMGRLMTVVETYDPAAENGRGAWVPQGRPALASTNPALKVSQNAAIAVEDHGQAKSFYIHAPKVATANAALAAANAPARIATTSAQITVPAVGARPARTLTQATATAQGNPTAVADIEATHHDALQMQVECHNLAAQLVGRDPTTAPARRTTPRVGEAYHFTSRGPRYVAPAGGDPEAVMRPFHHAPAGQRSFRGVLADLAAFDQHLARVSESYGMSGAMAQAAAAPDAAKAFLPGWGNHSEAVIARDGPDRLTLANYNRGTEAGWVAARAFREAYRHHAAFRRWFRPWYTQKLQQQFHLAANGAMSAEMLALVMTRFSNELMEQMAAHVPAEVAAAEKASLSAAHLGSVLWYFDLYGPAQQSFRGRYRQLGARMMPGSVAIAV